MDKVAGIIFFKVELLLTSKHVKIQAQLSNTSVEHIYLEKQ